MAVDRIDALVVIESQIEIPDRSHMHQIFIALLVHEHAPIGIGIT